MQSAAKTVAQYLAELPGDRRAAVEAVRRVIRANVSAEIEEVMQYGMISYVIPHRVFPDGYHCDPTQPVPYAAVASQKQHLAIYLMAPYISGEGDRWIRAEYEKKGKKLDMGKSCIRFKRLEELDLDVLAGAIARAPARAYLQEYVLKAGPNAWKKRRGTSAAAGGSTTAARTRKAAPVKKTAPAKKK